MDFSKLYNKIFLRDVLGYTLPGFFTLMLFKKISFLIPFIQTIENNLRLFFNNPLFIAIVIVSLSYLIGYSLHALYWLTLGSIPIFKNKYLRRIYDIGINQETEFMKEVQNHIRDCFGLQNLSIEELTDSLIEYYVYQEAPGIYNDEFERLNAIHVFLANMSLFFILTFIFLFYKLPILLKFIFPVLFIFFFLESEAIWKQRMLFILEAFYVVRIRKDSKIKKTQ